MPVPFPSPTFPQNYTPYPLKAFVPPQGINRSAAQYFRATPPPTAISYFDMVALQSHPATVTSNDGKTSLVVASAGTSFTFNLAGDGTAEIPVGIQTSP